MSRPVHPNIHASPNQAIERKDFVTLVMRDHDEASGEPHIYGERDGRLVVLLYNEGTDPTWQVVEAGNIERSGNKSLKLGIS